MRSVLTVRFLKVMFVTVMPLALFTTSILAMARTMETSNSTAVLFVTLAV